MFVKPGPRPDDPARQLIVRGPNFRVLSPIGEDVPESQFWNRRLRDGDVVDAESIVIVEGGRHAEAEAKSVEPAGAAPEPGFDPATPPLLTEATP